MNRLFSHRDGRLRTGRISTGLFVIILIGCSLLFWMREPVDQVLVKVKHIFVPDQMVQAEKPVQKKASSPARDPGKSSRPEIPAGNKAASTAHKSEKTAKPDLKRQIARDLPEKQTGTAGSAGETEKQEALTDPERLENLLTKFYPDDKKEIQPKENQRMTKKMMQKPTTSLEPAAKKSGHAITVGSKQYMELLQSWQESGAKSSEHTVYPLKVENLENTYELLQMKPVAETGNRLYDLSDGSRLGRKSLAGYTTTVFEVENVWDKWGPALREAGLKEGDNPRVRYYMYDFIRNGIYQRVGRAVDWCLEKGLLSRDLKPGEIDVRGRTYTINQEGGGSFGVFVPLALVTARQVISVDPACFAGEPDVDALRTAGLL